MWISLPAVPIDVRRPSTRLLTWALTVLLGFQLGAGCGKLAGIRIDDPSPQELFAQGDVSVAVRTGVELGQSSLELEIDGVAVIAGLGLTAPFMGESGVLAIGADSVSVSNFNVFTLQGVRRIQGDFSGFSPGTREVKVSGQNPETEIVVEKSSLFTIVDFFTLEVPHVPSAGAPIGPVASATEGTLANASLGQAVAAPPVATLGGKSIRSGHVEAVEGLIAGGP